MNVPLAFSATAPFAGAEKRPVGKRSRPAVVPEDRSDDADVRRRDAGRARGRHGELRVAHARSVGVGRRHRADRERVGSASRAAVRVGGGDREREAPRVRRRVRRQAAVGREREAEWQRAGGDREGVGRRPAGRREGGKGVELSEEPVGERPGARRQRDGRAVDDERIRPRALASLGVGGGRGEVEGPALRRRPRESPVGCKGKAGWRRSRRDAERVGPRPPRGRDRLTVGRGRGAVRKCRGSERDRRASRDEVTGDVDDDVRRPGRGVPDGERAGPVQRQRDDRVVGSRLPGGEVEQAGGRRGGVAREGLQEAGRRRLRDRDVDGEPGRARRDRADVGRGEGPRLARGQGGAAERAVGIPRVEDPAGGHREERGSRGRLRRRRREAGGQSRQKRDREGGSTGKSRHDGVRSPQEKYGIRAGIPVFFVLLACNAITQEPFGPSPPDRVRASLDPMARKTFRAACALAVLLFSFAILADGPPEARLLRFPDAWGDFVVFVYAGDIWRAPVAGGPASRLTAHPGLELFPKISPRREVDRLHGRVHRHAAGLRDAGLGRRAAAAHLLQRRRPDAAARRLRRLGPRLDEGRQDPRPDEPRPVERRAWAATTSSTRRAASRRRSSCPRAAAPRSRPTGRSSPTRPIDREFRTWKRTRGGRAQDVWIYDFAAKPPSGSPTGTGPTTSRCGRATRSTSRPTASDTLNLFAYDLKTKATRKVTDFTEYDVLWPSLGTGRHRLHERRLPLPRSTWRPRRPRASRSRSASDCATAGAGVQGRRRRNVSGADLSPSGARVVLEARGDLFTRAGQGRRDAGPRRDAGRARARARLVAGRQVDRVPLRRDRRVRDLRCAPQDGTGAPRRLTTDGAPWYFAPAWSPDGEEARVRRPQAAAADRRRRERRGHRRRPRAPARTSTPTAGRPTRAGSSTRRATRPGCPGLAVYSLEQKKSLLPGRRADDRLRARLLGRRQVPLLPRPSATSPSLQRLRVQLPLPARDARLRRRARARAAGALPAEERRGEGEGRRTPKKDEGRRQDAEEPARTDARPKTGSRRASTIVADGFVARTHRAARAQGRRATASWPPPPAPSTTSAAATDGRRRGALPLRPRRSARRRRSSTASAHYVLSRDGKKLLYRPGRTGS